MSTSSHIVDFLHYQKGILAETKKYNQESMERNQHYFHHILTQNICGIFPIIKLQ